jgi:hypothetical protein
MSSGKRGRAKSTNPRVKVSVPRRLPSSRVKRFRLVTRRSILYCTLTFPLPYCCRNVRRWGAFLAKTIVFPIGFQWCRFLTFSTQPKGSSAKPSTSSRRGEESDPEQRSVLRFGCAGCQVFRFVEYQPASERRLGKWSIFSLRVDMQYSGGAVSTCMSATCPFF